MTTPPVPPPPGNYPPPGFEPQGYYPTPPQGGYQLPPGTFYPYPYAPVSELPKHAYTSWITRVAAYAIDMVPMAVLFGIGLYAIAGRRICTEDLTDNSYSVDCISSPDPVAMIVFWVTFLAALAFWVWNYGYRQGVTGSTVGKSIMRFKVVSEASGQPIGFGMSLLRQLAHFLDGLFCNLGYLFPLWDAKRQTFADKIMSTVCLPTD